MFGPIKMAGTGFWMILVSCFGSSGILAGELETKNGWYLHRGKAIWGFAQYNGWWGAYRANITRNAPGEVGPNLTEDLDRLTDAMLQYGYPAFEHNYGLWYDRRRDRHDTGPRTDPGVLGPFLEQPWARSGHGKAWDGLSRYDLTAFNDWYFRRLKEFADLCDRKSAILLHNFYMQHALLETNAHYVDFPWRPANCIQDTGMPDRIPAANAFYDLSHSPRRKLHRAYIRKCLDVLGGNTNVIHLASQEFTGPLTFLEFWLDTVFEWEEERGRKVHVAASGTRDVLDAVLADPVRGKKVSSLDLRYFWYQPDGSLHAPRGGLEVPGRYASGGESAKTTPEAIYRQVREYRMKYPRKGIIHMINGSRQQTWAFLMGGGSILVRYLEYADKKETRYVAPRGTETIQPLYEFLRKHLAAALPETRPADLVKPSEGIWCLADRGKTYLVYALHGGEFQLDLTGAEGTYQVRWLDPREGSLTDAGTVRGGQELTFHAPGAEDWALWLARSNDSTQ